MARLRVWGLAILGLAACSKSAPFDGTYCEHGRAVKGGDCLIVRAERSADPSVVGVLEFKDRPKAGGTVRRDGKNKFTIHRDGNVVGEITKDGDDLQVTVTDADGTYAKHFSADRGPGPME